jgi:hypothetical protein
MARAEGSTRPRKVQRAAPQSGMLPDNAARERGSARLRRPGSQPGRERAAVGQANPESHCAQYGAADELSSDI